MSTRISHIGSFNDLLAWNADTHVPHYSTTIAGGVPKPSLPGVTSTGGLSNLRTLSSFNGGGCYQAQATGSRLDPKVLACHDFSGGDLPAEESFFNIDQGNTHNVYTVHYWSTIDIFVYFTHSRISVPPLEWITVAHRNNVSMLATIVTEHDEGKRDCLAMLQNGQRAKAIVDKLVQLAVVAGFDGYFLNIENPIPPNLIPALSHFVESLTQKMHAADPTSQVIWYDSVTTSGALQYQNALTPLNAVFLEKCDGIFLNYFWGPKNLQHTRETALRHVRSRPPPASLASSRGFPCFVAAAPKTPADTLLDTYVGTDIYGRNTYGGGGYSFDKALQLVVPAGQSVAVFAPAWTLERSNKTNRRLFYQIDSLFWKKVAPYLRASAYSGLALESRTLHRLPFATSLMQPIGKGFYVEGVLRGGGGAGAGGGGGNSSSYYGQLGAQDLDLAFVTVNNEPGRQQHCDDNSYRDRFLQVYHFGATPGTYDLLQGRLNVRDGFAGEVLADQILEGNASLWLSPVPKDNDALLLMAGTAPVQSGAMLELSIWLKISGQDPETLKGGSTTFDAHLVGSQQETRRVTLVHLHASASTPQGWVRFTGHVEDKAFTVSNPPAAPVVLNKVLVLGALFHQSFVTIGHLSLTSSALRQRVASALASLAVVKAVLVLLDDDRSRGVLSVEVSAAKNDDFTATDAPAGAAGSAELAVMKLAAFLESDGIGGGGGGCFGGVYTVAVPPPGQVARFDLRVANVAANISFRPCRLRLLKSDPCDIFRWDDALTADVWVQ